VRVTGTAERERCSTGKSDPLDERLYPGLERQDRSILLLHANLIVLFLSLPLAAALYLLFLLLRSPGARSPELDANGVLLFGLLFVAGIIVHEVLHAAGWIVFGKLPISRVGFGFKLSTLTPYAHLREAVRARTYRIGILLPLLVLGVPPYVLGIFLDRQLIMIYGLFFVLAAGGDLLVLWLLRGISADAWVEDHPTKAGCWVYTRPPSAAEPRVLPHPPDRADDT
jgi:hypothetical protein